MNSIKQWYLNHKNIAHVFVGLWVALQGAYTESPAFHQGVNNAVTTIYHAMPKELSGIIGSLVVPFLIYYNTQKRATITAEVSPGEQKIAAIGAAIEPEEKQ